MYYKNMEVKSGGLHELIPCIARTIVADGVDGIFMEVQDDPLSSSADITHVLQQHGGKKLNGGGVASGGLHELIPCIARTNVAVGVDGIFMEVQDDPLSASVDGPTQWPLRHLEELLEELITISRVTKGKQ